MNVAAIFTSVILLYTFNQFGQFLSLVLYDLISPTRRACCTSFTVLQLGVDPQQYTAVSCVDQGNSCCWWYPGEQAKGGCK